MIDAKQLRIGNLVYSAKSNYSDPAGIHKIFSLGGSEANHWQDMGASGGLRYSDISGIPLTPEILEKLMGQSADFAGCFHLWIRPDGIYLEQYHEGEEKLNNIKYVHQLQNVYFGMFAKELEINL
jgi:hypothetical protein